MSEQFLTGTFGVYKTKSGESSITVRLFEQPEIFNKMSAMVTIVNKDFQVLTNVVYRITLDEWDHIKLAGIDDAIAHGVNTTKQPFHAYIAKQYWELIK